LFEYIIYTISKYDNGCVGKLTIASLSVLWVMMS